MSGQRTSRTASDSDPWLVIVDPQRIFADPESPWASPFFDAAWRRIETLADRYAGRIVVTRWLPTADRQSAWGEYFEAWPFADVPATDPLYELVEPAARIVADADAVVVDEPPFGKWGAQLRAIVGEYPRLIVTGVSTDCCVIATALSAADDGAWVSVPTDAVAHSRADHGAAALHAMGLFEPQLRLTTAADHL